MIHPKNVAVKNADGKKNVDRQDVEWDNRSTGKTLNGKKHRKDKTSNGK